MKLNELLVFMKLKGLITDEDEETKRGYTEVYFCDINKGLAGRLLHCNSRLSNCSLRIITNLGTEIVRDVCLEDLERYVLHGA